MKSSLPAKALARYMRAPRVLQSFQVARLPSNAAAMTVHFCAEMLALRASLASLKMLCAPSQQQSAIASQLCLRCCRSTPIQRETSLAEHFPQAHCRISKTCRRSSAHKQCCARGKGSRQQRARYVHVRAPTTSQHQLRLHSACAQLMQQASAHADSMRHSPTAVASSNSSCMQHMYATLRAQIRAGTTALAMPQITQGVCVHAASGRQPRPTTSRLFSKFEWKPSEYDAQQRQERLAQQQDHARRLQVRCHHTRHHACSYLC